MARTGRPPLPSNVVRIRGNRSKLSEEQLRERERNEVKPHPVAPRAPKNLSPLERECWDQHAKELDSLGLLTVLDGASFRLQVCMPYALVFEALDSMRPRKGDGTIDRRKKGFEVVIPDPDHGGFRRHPGFLVWKQSVDQYRLGCREFGLTPSSRVGLRPGAPVGSVADDEDDDEKFFGTS